MKIRLNELRALLQEAISDQDVLSLERRLLDNPDDVDAWSVYADYLLDQDDQRGSVVQAHTKYMRQPSSDTFREFRRSLMSYRKSKDKAKSLNDTERRAGVHNNSVFYRNIRMTASANLKSILEKVMSDRNARLVRELHLTGPSVADAVYETLCSELMTQFRVLSISNAYIGPKLAEALADSNYLSQLKEISVRIDRIGDNGLRQMAQRSWPSLTKLTLVQCSLTDESANTLLNAAANFPVLTQLNLSQNSLSVESLHKLRVQWPNLTQHELETGA